MSTAAPSRIASYANPIKRDGDFADPFVLRFNGRYYLYATNPDIRCWSSADLVEWTLEGPTIAADVFPGLVPFAPEVVYSNGSFFMYTSPHGRGHHVLRSDQPTGPFELVSGNVEHSIDGNVLIDDDGRWYFYWAGDEGIWGCEMPTPTTFGEPVLAGPYMGGWTEGPFVSRHGDVYRMTLTGNHYLNDGYRINAAVSGHPLGPFVDDPLNPVLLSVRGAVTGVGHSSSVTGPDLLSTYLIYHNLNPDETRDLNLDRQVANVDSVQVLGPTTSAPAPARPGAAVDWAAGVDTAEWEVIGTLVVDGDRAMLGGDGASATWRAPTPEGPFVAEVNLAGAAVGRYGIELGMPGAGTRFEIAPESNTITALAVGAAGSTIVTTAALPAGFIHDRLHCYRIEHDGASLVLFVDGRRQLECAAAVVPGSRFSVVSDRGGCEVGFCALTAGSARAADRASVKPVPGRFWAALGSVPPAALERVGNPVRYDVVRLIGGAEVTYDLDIIAAGAYRVSLTGAFGPGDAIEIALGSSAPIRIDVATPTAVVEVPASLDLGGTQLRLAGAAGSPVVSLVTLSPVEPDPVRFELPGPFAVHDAGKALVSSESWHDLHLEAELDLQPNSDAFRGGMIFRASQLSEGGATSDDPVLGADFFLGYSVEFHRDALVLSRHSYDRRELVSVPAGPRTSVRVAVRMTGGHIEVALDGSVVITHDDPLPHLLGGVGLRTSGGSVTATALTIAPL